MKYQPSLARRKDALASPTNQLNLLNNHEELSTLPKFRDTLQPTCRPLRADAIEIFQVNLGKLCNQTCAHCHVDAGPDREEVMPPHIFRACLDVLATSNIPVVDITGGAPELTPGFQEFVIGCRALGKRIMVRCNLTVILSNKKYHTLPAFYRENEVEVICSLPHFSKGRTDKQRGEGVFDKSVEALRLLNQQGYAQPEHPEASAQSCIQSSWRLSSRRTEGA